MGVNSLPKTDTRQRRGCDLNRGPSAPESSKLTTWLYTEVPFLIYDTQKPTNFHSITLQCITCRCLSPWKAL